MKQCFRYLKVSLDLLDLLDLVDLEGSKRPATGKAYGRRSSLRPLARVREGMGLISLSTLTLSRSVIDPLVLVPH